MTADHEVTEFDQFAPVELARSLAPWDGVRPGFIDREPGARGIPRFGGRDDRLCQRAVLVSKPLVTRFFRDLPLQPVHPKLPRHTVQPDDGAGMAPHDGKQRGHLSGIGVAVELPQRVRRPHDHVQEHVQSLAAIGGIELRLPTAGYGEPAINDRVHEVRVVFGVDCGCRKDSELVIDMQRVLVEQLRSGFRLGGPGFDVVHTPTTAGLQHDIDSLAGEWRRRSSQSLQSIAEIAQRPVEGDPVGRWPGES